MGYTLGYCPVGHSASVFDEVFENKQDVSKRGFKGVDAVVFWGGEDIHPHLYGASVSRRTQVGATPSRRDLFEWQAMKYCKLHKIPMIGVCRGAQMLNVFAGGMMIQHVQGHNWGSHRITTKDDEILECPSAHHQMMFPFNTTHDMLAWSTIHNSGTYIDGTDSEIDMKGKVEPEVVWFPELRGLAIQSHPEWCQNKDPFAQYVKGLVNEYILQLSDIPF